jgi:hypothetical protein
MVKMIGCVALVLGMLAALAEITAFLMDRGGIIISMVRPTEAHRQPCPSDRNPVVKMLCEDKLDGPIRLDR